MRPSSAKWKRLPPRRGAAFPRRRRDGQRGAAFSNHKYVTQLLGTIPITIDNPFFYLFPLKFLLYPGKLVFKISFPGFPGTLGLSTHPTKSCFLLWVTRRSLTCVALTRSASPAPAISRWLGHRLALEKHPASPVTFHSCVNAAREPNFPVCVLARNNVVR